MIARSELDAQNSKSVTCYQCNNLFYKRKIISKLLFTPIKRFRINYLQKPDHLFALEVFLRLSNRLPRLTNTIQNYSCVFIKNNRVYSATSGAVYVNTAPMI